MNLDPCFSNPLILPPYYTDEAEEQRQLAIWVLYFTTYYKAWQDLGGLVRVRLTVHPEKEAVRCLVTCTRCNEMGYCWTNSDSWQVELGRLIMLSRNVLNPPPCGHTKSWEPPEGLDTLAQLYFLAGG